MRYLTLFVNIFKIFTFLTCDLIFKTNMFKKQSLVNNDIFRFSLMKLVGGLQLKPPAVPTGPRTSHHQVTNHSEVGMSQVTSRYCSCPDSHQQATAVLMTASRVSSPANNALRVAYWYAISIQRWRALQVSPKYGTPTTYRSENYIAILIV
jgi:hypothetical protein